MRPQQKRGLFNFLCAFMPGASEMNMGFMKMGLSIMAVFVISFGLIPLLSLNDIFMVVPMIMWFYGFFHARNLTHSAPEVFASLKDDFFWNELVTGKAINIKSETLRKCGAWALIVMGVLMLWNIVWDPISDYLQYLMYEQEHGRIAGYIYQLVYSFPKCVVGALIIVIGVKLILGKKQQLYITDTSSNPILIADDKKEEKNA
ncbi:hypothetical protein [Butyrivibrio sp. FC2001]|uniref:hypothetical protein n=1 Tax=Butyrivibrio sp. FC2001 TaxID=1280671 RepID=UPI0003F97ACE|nr:hypothetical protein [Butyrivibrio sp. FC2001]